VCLVTTPKLELDGFTRLARTLATESKLATVCLCVETLVVVGIKDLVVVAAAIPGIVDLAYIVILATFDEVNFHLWSVAAQTSALALSFKSEDGFISIVDVLGYFLDIDADGSAFRRHAVSVAAA
jgi:hypothetical protein